MVQPSQQLNIELLGTQYRVIIEKEDSSDWGAYVPDLPGCVAVGESREGVGRLIRGAITSHLRGQREDDKAGRLPVEQ